MQPEPGDELVIDGDQSGRGARVGTILDVRDTTATPVTWSTGWRAITTRWYPRGLACTSGTGSTTGGQHVIQREPVDD
jgi:Domain of unknown function (DUF1918)